MAVPVDLPMPYQDPENGVVWTVPSDMEFKTPSYSLSLNCLLRSLLYASDVRLAASDK